MRTYENRSAQGYGGPLWTEQDHAYLRENYTTMPAREIAARLRIGPSPLRPLSRSDN